MSHLDIGHVKTAQILGECTVSLHGRFESIRKLLKQPEDLEDDHDNDNHSNYVKNVSVHVGGD